jgi:hypothetical protein
MEIGAVMCVLQGLSVVWVQTLQDVPMSACLGVPRCTCASLRSLLPPFPSVLAPARPLRRKIHNPRILLLDCPLEYKKGENQTNVELMKEEDWWVLLGTLCMLGTMCCAAHVVE